MSNPQTSRAIPKPGIPTKSQGRLFCRETRDRKHPQTPSAPKSLCELLFPTPHNHGHAPNLFARPSLEKMGSLYSGSPEPAISNRAILAELAAIYAPFLPEVSRRWSKSLLTWMEKQEQNDGTFRHLPIGDTELRRIYIGLLQAASLREESDETALVAEHIGNYLSRQCDAQLSKNENMYFILECIEHLIESGDGDLAHHLLGTMSANMHIRLAYEMSHPRQNHLFSEDLRFDPEVGRAVRDALERLPKPHNAYEVHEDRVAEPRLLCNVHSCLLFLGRLAEQLQGTLEQQKGLKKIAQSKEAEPKIEKIRKNLRTSLQDTEKKCRTGIESVADQFIKFIRILNLPQRQTLLCSAIDFCSGDGRREHLGHLIPRFLNEHRHAWLAPAQSPKVANETEGEGSIELLDSINSADDARAAQFGHCLHAFAQDLQAAPGLSRMLRSAGLFQFPQHPLLNDHFNKTPYDLALLLTCIQSDFLDISLHVCEVLRKTLKPGIDLEDIPLPASILESEVLGGLAYSIGSFLHLFDQYSKELSKKVCIPSQEIGLGYPQLLRFVRQHNTDHALARQIQLAGDMWAKFCGIICSDDVFLVPPLMQALTNGKCFMRFGSVESSLVRDMCMLCPSHILAIQTLGSKSALGADAANKEIQDLQAAMRTVHPSLWLVTQTLLFAKTASSCKVSDRKAWNQIRRDCQNLENQLPEMFYELELDMSQDIPAPDLHRLEELFAAWTAYIVETNRFPQTKPFALRTFLFTRKLLDGLRDQQARQDIWIHVLQSVGPEILLEMREQGE